MATASPIVENLSSTARMLVEMEKNNLGLHSKSPEEVDYKAIMNSVIERIPFEAEVARARREIKSHVETNTLRTFLNETQDHILKIKDDKTGLNTKALNLKEELNKLEDDLAQLSDSFLKTCDERLAAKRAGDKVKLAEIEQKLQKELLLKANKIFKEEEKLKEKIHDLSQEGINAGKLRGIPAPTPTQRL